MKSRPLAPETPWTTSRRALIYQSFCIRVTVVVEHYEIGSTRRRYPLTRSVQLNARMSNFRRLPAAIRIAAAKITNLQRTLTLRFDLVEQLNLIRRGTICQHENSHRVFTCLNFMKRCDRPTHASTT